LLAKLPRALEGVGGRAKSGYRHLSRYPNRSSLACVLSLRRGTIVAASCKWILLALEGEAIEVDKGGALCRRRIAKRHHVKLHEKGLVKSAAESRFSPIGTRLWERIFVAARILVLDRSAYVGLENKVALNCRRARGRIQVECLLAVRAGAAGVPPPAFRPHQDTPTTAWLHTNERVIYARD